MDRTSSSALLPCPRRRNAFGGVLLSLHLLASTGALGAVVTWASPAQADASNQAAEVLFILENLPGNLDPERVRAAVARELGASVTLAEKASSGANALTLHGGEGQYIRLSYRAADGRVTEREVDLPEESSHAVELIALLAGNLVRDEAAELGAALKRRAEEPPPPAPVAPATTTSITVVSPPQRTADPSPCVREDLPQTLVGVDFLPHVGTSSFLGTGVSRRLSLNILAGSTAGLRGVEIGGLVNVDSAVTCGLQIGGIANLTLGPVEGAQLGGIANLGHRLVGVQAGLVNIATGGALGVQTGLVDIVNGELRGAQLGLIEVASSDVRGLQAGLVNTAGGAFTGAQVGLVNLAGGSVRGAQIGLINVSTTSTFSFGLINIIRQGRLHVDLWGQESGLLMAGIKHGSGHFHNIYGVGVLPFGGHARLALSLGLGAHLPLTARLFLDVDALDYAIFGSSSLAATVSLGQARVVLGASLLDHLAIYGGPSYNVATSWDGKAPALAPYGANFEYDGDKIIAQGWPGLVLGLQAL